MAESTALGAISYLAERLRVSGIRVNKIILFGSHASGQAVADSGIDVIIISVDFEGKDVFDRARVTKDAEVSTIRKFSVPNDIIALTPSEAESETSLIGGLARKGKIVYAA